MHNSGIGECKNDTIYRKNVREENKEKSLILRHRKGYAFLVFLLLLISSFSPVILHADSINSTNKYARFRVDDSLINFGTSNGSVDVTSSTITGYAWAGNAGWINLAPANGGITRDGGGNLSGYAWGEGTGWINFAPTNGGVSIDSSGFFHGEAWSESKGWILFNCDDDSSCATVDHKVQVNQGADDPDDGGEDGGSSSTPDSPTDLCSNIFGIQTSIPEGFFVSEGQCVPIDPDDPSDPDDPILPPDLPDGPDDPGDEPGIPPDEPPITDLIPDFIDDFIPDLPGFTPPEGNPIPGNVENVASLSGLFAGLIALTIALTSLVGSLQDLAYLPMRIWNSLLGFLGFRKKSRPWGTVYDSVTKQPLDPAYVVLKTPDGRDVQSAITDLDGRYGFLSKPGTYTVVANKTHYVFPSVKLAGKHKDELYQNLYFGEQITINDDADVIARDIPMDPIGFDWNEFQKGKKKLLVFYSRFDKWITRLLDLLFYTGFFVSLIAFYYAPGPYNAIILVMYIAIFMLRIMGVKQRLYGKIKNDRSGRPLSFAILRVFNADLGKEVMHRIADQFGRYYALVPRGEYYVQIDKKLPDGSYEKVYISKKFRATNGIIKKVFKV